jgi:phosphate transport system permease protein
VGKPQNHTRSTLLGLTARHMHVATGWGDTMTAKEYALPGPLASRSPKDNPADEPRRPDELRSFGDRLYTGIATACATVSLVIVGMTFVFLLWQSKDVFKAVSPWAFLTKSSWNAGNNLFGVGGLILGTFLIAIIALAVAAPVSIAMALFINEYAPRRLRTVLTSVIDLLAAIPSLIFGFWGFFALMPRATPLARFVSEHLSAIPLFRVDSSNPDFKQSGFVAGLVVGIMIIPIIASVSRDVMSQVPRELCEGALALGGTRWGMIREVVLPFGRSGIVGAALLGLGRALGETIAVALIISFKDHVQWQVLEKGAGAVAALIVTRFGEASGPERSGLIAAGLALFGVTFAVNYVSRRIVARSAKDWAVR